jgi:hypothetical protein
MQSDFDNLVCDDTSISTLPESPLSPSIFDGLLEPDMETLMNKYKNISEEALVFLVDWQRAAANRPMHTKPKVSASIEQDLGEIKIINRSASCPSTCAIPLLPPPKRFCRAPRGATQTSK